jgi:hypothetical protein
MLSAHCASSTTNIRVRDKPAPAPPIALDAADQPLAIVVDFDKRAVAVGAGLVGMQWLPRPYTRAAVRLFWRLPARRFFSVVSTLFLGLPIRLPMWWSQAWKAESCSGR